MFVAVSMVLISMSMSAVVRVRDFNKAKMEYAKAVAAAADIPESKSIIIHTPILLRRKV